VKDDKLIAAVFNNRGELEAIKNMNDQFTSAAGSKVSFIRDENGNVIKVKVNGLGMTFEGKKQ
jgi:hypothetical protein